MGKVRNSKLDAWLTEDSLLLISCWVRDGATELDIAKNIGISTATLIRWKNDNPQFQEALSKKRELVDYKVESALYKRAIGCKTVEVKTVIDARPDNNGNRVVRTERTEKEVLPDVTACLAWLNNRKPDEWKRNRDNFANNSQDNGCTITIVPSENKIEVNRGPSINLDEEDWDNL